MTFSIFTAKLKGPPNGLLRHTGECRENDYEHCSSSDDRLGTDVGTSANQTLYLSMQYAIVDFAKNVDSTPWLSSQTADQPRPKTEHLQTTWDIEPVRMKRYMETEMVNLPTVQSFKYLGSTIYIEEEEPAKTWITG